MNNNKKYLINYKIIIQINKMDYNLQLIYIK